MEIKNQSLKPGLFSSSNANADLLDILFAQKSREYFYKAIGVDAEFAYKRIIEGNNCKKRQGNHRRQSRRHNQMFREVFRAKKHGKSYRDNASNKENDIQNRMNAGSGIKNSLPS